MSSLQIVIFSHSVGHAGVSGVVLRVEFRRVGVEGLSSGSAWGHRTPPLLCVSFFLVGCVRFVLVSQGHSTDVDDERRPQDGAQVQYVNLSGAVCA